MLWKRTVVLSSRPIILHHSVDFDEFTTVSTDATEI